ncbi:MAG TPA: toxin-antitoxin system HicB family antitoxin [Solirubrobacteraceae bacterium]|jgi:hypothetical protein|nr:toxin-antitoxin system HicB family antitoxin [Solirubrobacteraceae bacterium]
MELEPHITRVQEQLAAAAALGDERTREIADALTTAALPAVRLALLDAVSTVADEITAALLDHPGSPAIAVRIDSDEVTVDVRALQTHDDAAQPRQPEGELSARISLRLTEALKADIDAAAERDGVSVNTWLARAAGHALRPGAPDGGQDVAGRGWGRRSENHHVSGWING